MLKEKRRSGRWYSRRKHFAAQRELAFARDGESCRVSGQPLKFAVVSGDVPGKIMWNRACDHVYPERWLRRFLPGADPHILENLLTIHPSIHGQKTAAEVHLYSGNGVGFYAEMTRIGYSREFFSKAWDALQRSQNDRARKRGKR